MVCERFADRVGSLCGGLRTGPNPEGIPGGAISTGRRRGRGLACCPGVALSLVPSRREGARQRLLDALPARSRGYFLPHFRLDTWPLGLARHDRFRRRAALSVAVDLELVHRRPPAQGSLDLNRRTRISGSHAAARIGGA